MNQHKGIVQHLREYGAVLIHHASVHLAVAVFNEFLIIHTAFLTISIHKFIIISDIAKNNSNHRTFSIRITNAKIIVI